MSVATPDAAGWSVSIEAVGPLSTLFARFRERAGSAPVAFGVDAPIGLPLAFQRDHADFPSFLGSLGPDAEFFHVNDDAATISMQRPFFPNRSGGTSPQSLLDRLGLPDQSNLLRACERPLNGQAAAGSMFWTLGAKQVGKGAIVLWRDLILPARRSADPPSLWPFEGTLAELLRPNSLLIAECYPANAMRQMRLCFTGGKNNRADRLKVASRFHAIMADLAATPHPSVSASIDSGFDEKCADDKFDSLIGLLRMLQVIRDPTKDTRPSPEICRWEGWILGRPLNIP